MKIKSEKTNQPERPDEPAEKDAAEKSKEKKDFKKLLEGKRKGKKGKRGEKGKGKADGKLTGKKTKEPAPKQPARAESPDAQPKRGELQLGRQAKQKERLGTERNVARHQDETRLEHRHRKKHRRKVHTDHKHKGEQQKQQIEAASVAAQNVEPKADVGQVAAKKAQKSAPTQRTELRKQVAELAKKLVDKAHMGRDAAGRQIMLLDLQVPGRGNVRVRLRRRGDGFELRMRPENQELARDLRRERDHFRQTAADKGVDFSSIEIV